MATIDQIAADLAHDSRFDNLVAFLREHVAPIAEPAPYDPEAIYGSGQTGAETQVGENAANAPDPQEPAPQDPA